MISTYDQGNERPLRKSVSPARKQNQDEYDKNLKEFDRRSYEPSIMVFETEEEKEAARRRRAVLEATNP